MRINSQPYRLPTGGLIDRERPLHFTFNGRDYLGFHGDTLASALLANGVRLVARSFKYHRPRGIYGGGSEEPNALVCVGTGATASPNLKATQVYLHAGLVAETQNCWPSVAFDFGSIAGRLSRLMPAGFYYKTFMWPPDWWRLYERQIRRAAGMGRAPRGPDPDQYSHRYAHCDVLVIGGGAAGLAATLAAARAGARTILIDERNAFGGTLLGRPAQIEGMAAQQWVGSTIEEVETLDVRLLSRTTAFGYYDDNMICAIEQAAAGDQRPYRPEQRLWWIRARRVVLATGALERGFAFGNNDLPGVMLASAAREYVNRFAVRPGERAVVFTNNDTAYWAARDLLRGGVGVEAIVDVRPVAGSQATASARQAGIRTLPAHAVLACRGSKRVVGVEIVAIDASAKHVQGRSTPVACDLVAVSGGWNPTVHLFSQSGGRLRYDEAQSMFRPLEAQQALRCAGAADGTFNVAGCLRDGYAAGSAAAAQAGLEPRGAAPSLDCQDEEAEERPVQPLWVVPEPAGRRHKRFVDLQNDVTVDDIALAAREGYRSVEHVKRYTTLGMGTDQGRTSNVLGLAILADILGVKIGEVGTTTFRPPYSPVAFGAFAGDRRDTHYAPIRRTPMHAWHMEAGAAFVPAGLWLRSQVYRRPGESLMAAINREAINVRQKVGMVDVSTLGKIDVQGADAGAFLDRIYANDMSHLAVGRVRYGVMLREDGIVFDDGTAARIGDHQFVITTTTSNAHAVLSHLEYCHQVLWPRLNVHITAVTEDWAAMALAGPRSREVLQALVTADVGNASLPFMGFCAASVAGVPSRLFRISFSGELAYEINVPADYGRHVWESILDAGGAYGIAPYGTEAMAVLRIEKGHVASGELNGRTTADDLGLGRLLSARTDFVGRRSLSRLGMLSPRRRQLVGLTPVDRRTPFPRGAQLVADSGGPASGPLIGEVTSACHSPILDMPVALGLVEGGRSRHGEKIIAVSPLANTSVPVTILHPVFIDRNGERLRG